MTRIEERPRIGGWRKDGRGDWVFEEQGLIVYENPIVGGWHWCYDGAYGEWPSQSYSSSTAARLAAEQAARKP